MSARRVLVVDDVVAAAEAVAMVLGLAGHEVRTARSTAEALAAARAFEPEIVISDLHLGNGPDGWALAAALRDDPGQAGARLIAMTGLDGPNDRLRALEAGFDAVLTKPVDPTRLIALVDEAARPA